MLNKSTTKNYLRSQQRFFLKIDGTIITATSKKNNNIAVKFVFYSRVANGKLYIPTAHPMRAAAITLYKL